MLQAQPHFAHTVNALGNHGHRPAAALSVKQHPLQNTAPTAAPAASGAAAGPRTHRQTRLMLAHTMTQPSLALKGHGLGASGQSTEAPSLPATHWQTQLALPQIPSKRGGGWLSNMVWACWFCQLVTVYLANRLSGLVMALN